jgi:hypothetical protein
MNIFKTPSPQTSNPSEMMRSQPMGMPFDLTPMRPTGNVKVAQSFDEIQMNMRSGCCGDSGARSVEHVSRPRYGHKV